MKRLAADSHVKTEVTNIFLGGRYQLLPAEAERTGWLAADQPPERVGVYEVITGVGFGGWAWWTGDAWGECYPDLRTALLHRGRRYKGCGFHTVARWRGVARPMRMTRTGAILAVASAGAAS